MCYIHVSTDVTDVMPERLRTESLCLDGNGKHVGGEREGYLQVVKGE